MWMSVLYGQALRHGPPERESEESVQGIPFRFMYLTAGA